MREGVAAGAVGFSTGPTEPWYADLDELVALAGALALDGGLYVSHIRNEADRSTASVEEAITIAERAGATPDLASQGARPGKLGQGALSRCA
ncbi:MAG: hypothetical protein U0531_15280 [Dehalococcoidia bacterium]